MENLSRRKPIRISKYDYSRNGYYYVTVCTRDKQPIFWDTPPVEADTIRRQTCADDDGRLIAAPTETPPIRLSAYGKIVDQAIQNIPATYPNVFVDTYVIMPDHIHMILVISGAALPEQGQSSPTLMRVIGQMKRWASKNAGIPIWQKSFYEHVIRKYDDYIDIAEYIMNNPRKLMMRRNPPQIPTDIDPNDP